jgi:hypothetical protein
MNTLRSSSATCLAGASKADITPEIPVFLYGYPNCARMAEAVNDRLEANVLFIRTSGVELFLVSCDLAFVSARLARRVQGALAPARVLIGATHTHSGPVTVPYVLEFEDPYVPGPDADYLERLERKLVEACVAARASATPASLSHAVASSLGLGRHRHDPARPVDARMPVLACRDQGSGSLLAIWVICPMHPTVLHEDFRAVSGDFPGLGRHLLRNRFGDLPVVHWAGVCGDLSPRHVVQSNTLGEASRLGSVYAEEIRLAISRLTELDMTSVVTARAEVSLPLRDVPGESDAERQLEEARERLAQLRGLADASVSRARIRTAECDMFGAECRRSRSACPRR